MRVLSLLLSPWQRLP
uniref:Uncharacterized protein n=1 Tax=Arundo donax TaxID=35708 RepID=A0A0A8XWP1_ARUDO